MLLGARCFICWGQTNSTGFTVEGIYRLTHVLSRGRRRMLPSCHGCSLRSVPPSLGTLMGFGCQPANSRERCKFFYFLLVQNNTLGICVSLAWRCRPLSGHMDQVGKGTTRTGCWLQNRVCRQVLHHHPGAPYPVRGCWGPSSQASHHSPGVGRDAGERS